MRKKRIIHVDDVKKYRERKKNNGVKFEMKNGTFSPLYPDRLFCCTTSQNKTIYITANDMEIVYKGIVFFFYYVMNGEIRKQTVGYITDVISVVEVSQRNIEEDLKKFEQGFAYKPPECKTALHANQDASSLSAPSDINPG